MIDLNDFDVESLWTMPERALQMLHHDVEWMRVWAKWTKWSEGTPSHSPIYFDSSSQITANIW